MYLNVALAVRNCDFAEIRGYIAGPQKPGLGYEIDRDKIDQLTLKRC
jgi:L-alanine-DL-glutamate epimerase-like enolase superfamily enzyme